MKLYSENEKKEILDLYFNLHGDSYQPNQIEFIRRKFGSNNTDAFMQIYHAMYLLDEEENPYIGFADIIEKLYGMDINILEVGGGVYPALSEEIAKRQFKIGKGSITVFDPLLSKKLDMKHISLNKRNFDHNENISYYDLIIGKEPCYATTAVIESAKRSKKDLIISPCKCYGLLPYYMEYDEDPLKQWYDYVKFLINMENGDFKTYYLTEKQHYDNPIYSKTLK